MTDRSQAADEIRAICGKTASVREMAGVRMHFWQLGKENEVSREK